MKGSYFLGGGRFEVREMGALTIGETDVLIRNMAAGVCGTDVHIYHGEKGSAEVTPPVVLGHEYSGIVEKIGARVTTCRAGDRVTVDPNIYCGKCRFCRNGQKQLCENLYAIGVNRDGGFAEYSAVPQTQVFPVRGALTFEEMAMAEPLACCIHGIERVPFQTGDTVLVVGGGAIGLMMTQLAYLRGASRVYVSEPVAARRELALSLGAAGVIDPLAGDPLRAFQERSGRNGADVVIECVGSVSAQAQALAFADQGGRVLLFSVPKPDAVLPVNAFQIFAKELSVYGSKINPDTHLQAVTLLESGRVRVKELITHRFPLDRVEDAIRTQMSSESIKVVVMPSC